MRDIWLTSDTHFGHANILKFRDSSGFKFRGDLFESVQHMDETMIERWNSVVKPQDIVYHLGDVIMCDAPVQWMENNWKRLNGHKRLIVGNHDNIKLLAGYGWFEKILMWRMFPEHGVILSHVPLHNQSMINYRQLNEDGSYGKFINIHGHIHQNLSPGPDYRCVCVEHTNYTPVSIEQAKNLNNFVVDIDNV